MKTKYFLIYVFVGIAFLAVSAWVFFTRGKSAKAIRAKYKLGGVLLMCMAMLSVASCGEILDPGEVTCYDPVVEPMDNTVTMYIKHQDPASHARDIKPGETMLVEILYPTHKRFVLRILLNDEAGTVLQRNELVVDDGADSGYYNIPLSEDVTYKGDAVFQIHGIVKDEPEELSQTAYYDCVIHIL